MSTEQAAQWEQLDHQLFPRLQTAFPGLLLDPVVRFLLYQNSRVYRYQAWQKVIDDGLYVVIKGAVMPFENRPNLLYRAYKEDEKWEREVLAFEKDGIATIHKSLPANMIDGTSRDVIAGAMEKDRTLHLFTDVTKRIGRPRPKHGEAGAMGGGKLGEKPPKIYSTKVKLSAGAILAAQGGSGAGGPGGRGDGGAGAGAHAEVAQALKSLYGSLAASIHGGYEPDASRFLSFVETYPSLVAAKAFCVGTDLFPTEEAFDPSRHFIVTSPNTFLLRLPSQRIVNLVFSQVRTERQTGIRT